MTYGWIKPQVDVHGGAGVNPSRRKKDPIPGMHPEAGRQHCKLSDEEVIAIIIEHMRGTDYRRIAAHLEIRWTQVYAWCEGVNRRGCWIEADRRYREQLAQAAAGVKRTP